MDTKFSAASVFEALREVMNNPHSKGVEFMPHISARLAEWVLEWEPDYNGHEDGESVLELLERIDCAACNAPGGLIYTSDLLAELAHYPTEIEQALESYEDVTGETWSPPKPVSLGAFVWFAYEWCANELAYRVREAV